MRRTGSTAIDEPGQDSFLDVVANMVGILIILVMVVGVRAGDTPDVPASISAPEHQQHQLEREAISLRSDVAELDLKSTEIRRTIEQRRSDRDLLATIIEKIRQDLEAQRGQLDTAGQARYELAVRLERSRRELADLDSARAAEQARPSEKVIVQSLPTPISKTVHGDELHLRLQGDRVAVVPMEELIREFRTDAENNLWKLKDQDEILETVGPIAGFRMRYLLGRFDVSGQQALEGARVASVVQLVRFEILPVAEETGEPIDLALSESSQLREELRSLNPRRTTITVWTYPDSFSTFRRLKAELYALGYATAARPLPIGQPISGSPEGSRSAAQ
ncbi:MAG: hypothetical protein KDA42_08450 [Planctomycetales bacterium]|nr:hypothetical protein [Planctomycetales bacterium]